MTTPRPTTSPDAGQKLSLPQWAITTHKLPILASQDIDAMSSELGITPPEMIFGHNRVLVQHESGFRVDFNALDALRGVDKTGEGLLKVAYSESWTKMRERVHEDIREVVKPFDWTYSTAYRGSVNESPNVPKFEKTEEGIPFERLKRPDPILLFDDVVLYEDELADNGIAILSVKIRVHPERLFVLARFYLRLDGVLIRVRDTRVFVEFATGEVIREYQAREDTYQNVKSKMYARSMEEIPGLMRDPQYVCELTPIVEMIRDKAVLGPLVPASTSAPETTRAPAPPAAS